MVGSTTGCFNVDLDPSQSIVLISHINKRAHIQMSTTLLTIAAILTL
jgi:hypothetical protein